MLPLHACCCLCIICLHMACQIAGHKLLAAAVCCVWLPIHAARAASAAGPGCLLLHPDLLVVFVPHGMCWRAADAVIGVVLLLTPIMVLACIDSSLSTCTRRTYSVVHGPAFMRHGCWPAHTCYGCMHMRLITRNNWPCEGCTMHLLSAPPALLTKPAHLGHTYRTVGICEGCNHAPLACMHLLRCFTRQHTLATPRSPSRTLSFSSRKTLSVLKSRCNIFLACM